MIDVLYVEDGRLTQRPTNMLTAYKIPMAPMDYVWSQEAGYSEKDVQEGVTARPGDDLAAKFREALAIRDETNRCTLLELAAGKFENPFMGADRGHVEGYYGRDVAPLIVEGTGLGGTVLKGVPGGHAFCIRTQHIPMLWLYNFTVTGYPTPPKVEMAAIQMSRNMGGRMSGVNVVNNEGVGVFLNGMGYKGTKGIGPWNPLTDFRIERCDFSRNGLDGLRLFIVAGLAVQTLKLNRNGAKAVALGLKHDKIGHKWHYLHHAVFNDVKATHNHGHGLWGDQDWQYVELNRLVATHNAWDNLRLEKGKGPTILRECVLSDPGQNVATYTGHGAIGYDLWAGYAMNVHLRNTHVPTFHVAGGDPIAQVDFETGLEDLLTQAGWSFDNVRFSKFILFKNQPRMDDMAPAFLHSGAVFDDDLEVRLAGTDRGPHPYTALLEYFRTGNLPGHGPETLTPFPDWVNQRLDRLARLEQTPAIETEANWLRWVRDRVKYEGL